MRSLAIGLLALSLVGGYWLGTDRETQQHNAVGRETGLRQARSAIIWRADDSHGLSARGARNE